MRKSAAYLLFAGLLAASPVWAVTRTWLSSAGGSWTNTANWSGGVLPVASDVADLTAATGTIDLAANVTVGEILYNPAFIGTTNTLTILSDTAAPASKTITLTTTLTNHVQVGEGAELLMDADLKPTGTLRKDGYGTLVIKRRVPPTTRTDFHVEQGRLVNEGVIAVFASRMHLGTVAPDAGAAPEFVMREGASYYSTTAAQGSDVLLGGNRLLAGGTGARAVVTHAGGVLDLTTNATGGVFLNGYATNSTCVYNLSGGEVNLRTKGVYVAFYGTGTVSQTGGKMRASYINFTSTSSGNGTYNLTGGELWLGGNAQKGSGVAAFNLGGGCLYPLSKGFFIDNYLNTKLTGVNGLTRFCSTGREFTNTVCSLSGASGFVKEGADTLNLAGLAHSFGGPLIVSNGTVNVLSALNVSNAVLIADGNFNLGTNVYNAASFGSLMVTGGVFQVASNSLPAITGSDPWVRVAGTGTVRLLGGAALLRLAVAESGSIDLSAGGTASVYRFVTNGVELAPGLYTSANCAAITGSGTLAVLLKKAGTAVADTFTRANGSTANDSLGVTEVGGADWAEFVPTAALSDTASITNNELRLGDGTLATRLVLSAASWPNGVASTRMRFNLVGSSGATVKDSCGLILRRSISIRSGITATDAPGMIEVLMSASGGLFLRENYSSTKYNKNPFTGADYLTYGAAGSLPASINGAPFDANGDGKLGSDEPFDLAAIVSGSRVQVLINGAPVMAYSSLAAANVAADNCAGLLKNQMLGANAEVHDSYHAGFAVTNLPYVIRHVGRYDPSVSAATPQENWGIGGNTNLAAVGPVTETAGGETVDAWKIDDASSAGGAMVDYATPLSAAEVADVNTNRWRFKMRLRVVNTNDAVDWGVCGQVSAAKAFLLKFGSDAAGNALVTLNDASTNVVAGGSVYHTYVVDYNPGTSNATLSCDGALLQSGVAWTSGSYNRVLFGSGSSADQGCAHYQLVQFEFPPPPVPPPLGTLIQLK